MALAQHLYRAEKGRLEERIKSNGGEENEELKGQLDALSEEKNTLAAQIDDQARTISDLLESMSHLDKDSGQYREELERLQTAIFALEEQSSAATEHLADAYSELTHSNFQLSEMQTTSAFMKAVGDVLAQEHDEEDLPITLLSWFCEYFGIERFSLMIPDPRNETLGIAFARGISEEVVRRVRVRIGQGIAGWVAHNRKPLLVQSKEDENVAHTEQDRYNSDSYLSVPLIHNNYLYGVINFSNKSDGKVFNEHDLDRAAFLSTFIAMSYDRAATPGKVAARM